MKITGGATVGSACQPTSPPSPLENLSLHYSYYLFPSFSPRPHTLDGVGGYEMACGHCRRPRKEILAFNFDQLCWIRGLSSSPKSQGGSKVMLRGSKMAPEIASWDPENSPGRPEAHPGRALALPAPRKAPGSVRAAADCTPPGEGPGGPGSNFSRSAHLPQNSLKKALAGSEWSEAVATGL